MRCHRNLNLVYINYPVIKLASLYNVSLQFQEPIDDVKWVLAVVVLIVKNFHAPGETVPPFRLLPRFNLLLPLLYAHTAVLPLPLLCKPLLSQNKMPSFWRYISVKWITWSPPHKINSFYIKPIQSLTCSWASLRTKSWEPLSDLGSNPCQNPLQANGQGYPTPCPAFSSGRLLKLHFPLNKLGARHWTPQPLLGMQLKRTGRKDGCSPGESSEYYLQVKPCLFLLPVENQECNQLKEVISLAGPF